MYINHIELKNFRNYNTQAVSFENGVNVLYGNNAQGKTNLLEAVFLCSIGKSHRGVPDREMISHGCDFASVVASISAAGRDYRVECIITANKRKLIKVNGVPLERTAELIGMFNAVLFTPDDMNIITGGPSLRRRLIDMFISQLRPVYLSSLINYNKALEQKSRLFKIIDKKPSLLDTFQVWNAELAKYGAVIIKYRADYINKLSEIMGNIHSDITNCCENSFLSYVCNAKVSSQIEIKDIESAFLEELTQATKREFDQKVAIIGPHRDDIMFYVKQDKAKNYASRGQCRTVVLSLRLAQLEAIKQERGEYPVLLLDDITSELDINRRNYLFKKVNGMQAIITCTDAELIGKGSRFFKIEKGVIY